MNIRYRVIWKRSIIDIAFPAFLAKAEQRGDDVNAIARAMSEIDQLLAFEPEEQGESRENYERVLIVSPLSVTFEVFEEESIVVILGARYSPAHPPAG